MLPQGPTILLASSTVDRQRGLAYMSSSVLSSPTPRMRSNPSKSSYRMVESAFPLLMRKGWMTMYFFMGAITTRTCSFCRVRTMGAGNKSSCWMRPENQYFSILQAKGASFPHTRLCLLGFVGLKFACISQNYCRSRRPFRLGERISPPASARSVAGGSLPESARSRDLCPESAT